MSHDGNHRGGMRGRENGEQDHIGWPDRGLVTVPSGELPEGRASPGEVLCAGDAMVAASVERLMTSEGWKVPMEQKGRRQQGVLATRGDLRLSLRGSCLPVLAFKPVIALFWFVSASFPYYFAL